MLSINYILLLSFLSWVCYSEGFVSQTKFSLRTTHSLNAKKKVAEAEPVVEVKEKTTVIDYYYFNIILSYNILISHNIFQYFWIIY